ncbi:MAG: hypothetical protein C4326_06635 [Ignavibacteria bacterium]
MTALSSTPSPTPLELLAQIRTLVQDARTEEALERAEHLKALCPKNIFVAGLHVQLARLAEAEAHTSPDRDSLREPLSSLFMRAFESLEGKAVAEPEQRRASDSAARTQALASLKRQYFQITDALMRRGEYIAALEEVNRIRTLDPNDQAALEYTRKLSELIAAQHVAKAEGNEHSSPTPAGTRRSAPSTSLKDLMEITTPDFDAILAKASPPPPSATAKPARERPNERTATSSRSRTRSFLVSSAVLILIAIVASYLLTTFRHEEDGKTIPNAPRAVSPQPAKPVPKAEPHSAPVEKATTEDSTISTNTKEMMQ